MQYVKEIKSIARQHGAESIALIMDIARNLENPPAVRLAAAIHILDRGYGKPESHASVQLDGGDVRQLSTGDIIRLLQARGIVPGQDQDAIEVESEVVSNAPVLAENEG